MTTHIEGNTLFTRERKLNFLRLANESKTLGISFIIVTLNLGS
jgi:hypothetical protein